MLFKITSNPLYAFDLKDDFASPRAGAFASFEGWVRNQNDKKAVVALEYEALSSVCEKEAQKIFAEVQQRFDVIDVRCVHRTGKLSIGEMAVWVGVLAAHRDDAFKACRYVIDELKKRLPIWKKEFYANGESDWVNCQTCAHQTAGINAAAYYSRQTNLEEFNQEKLNAAKVLVVGAGGLGTAALMSLAGAGVGRIGICEHDLLDESNLHRQFLYAHSDVGKSKLQLAKARLLELNPSLEVVEHAFKCSGANVETLIDGYDIVLDCTDNFETKFLLNDACFLHKKILVTASVYQYEGQVRTIDGSQKGCLRCLWPETPAQGCVGTCAEAGVIGAVAQTIGHMQAFEAIKWIVGMHKPSGETILMDLHSLQLRKIRNFVNPSCPLCGDCPTIQSIDAQSFDHLSLSMEDVNKISDNVVFVDIREIHEQTEKPIEHLSTEQMPLSAFEKNRLSDEVQYVFICAKGKRSQNLVVKLARQGSKNIYSLAGGVESLPRLVEEVIHE